jgi:hypothetical protein
MKFTLLFLSGALAVTAAIPDFKITPVPGGKHKPFQKVFSQHINVFGVRVFGTTQTPAAKLRHIAIVLAEYLDNDEDGKPDNPAVVTELVKRNAFMAVAENERAMDRLDGEAFERAGFHAGQGQFATETLPGGGRFDATLEEVLHLITHEGYANAYPKIFGERPGTVLAQCLDRARGGGIRRGRGLRTTTARVITAANARSIFIGRSLRRSARSRQSGDRRKFPTSGNCTAANSSARGIQIFSISSRMRNTNCPRVCRMGNMR